MVLQGASGSPLGQFEVVEAVAVATGRKSGKGGSEWVVAIDEPLPGTTIFTCGLAVMTALFISKM
jgi:hypothetical protein